MGTSSGMICLSGMQPLNRTEAYHAKTVPDDKLTWTASEVLAMVREAIGADYNYNAF